MEHHQREDADRDHEQTGPMVIVFRPGNVVGIARRQFPGTWNEGDLRGRFTLFGFGVQLGLQRRQRQIGVVGAGEARPDRGVAFDDLRPGDAVVDQIDGGWDRGQGCGREEDGGADAEFDLSEAPHTGDGGRGVGPQFLSEEKIHAAEAQQHQEHRDLGADHDPVGGAVEAVGLIDIERQHDDAAEQDRGDSGHRDAGEAGAGKTQRGAVLQTAQRDQEAGNAADPDGGAGLMQPCRDQQWGPIVQPRLGVGG